MPSHKRKLGAEGSTDGVAKDEKQTKKASPSFSATTVAVVTYHKRCTPQERAAFFGQAVHDADERGADIVLFPGWTFDTVERLKAACAKATVALRSIPLVVMEVSGIGNGDSGLLYYCIRGEVVTYGSKQYFCDRNGAGKAQLFAPFIQDVKDGKRTIDVAMRSGTRHKVFQLQCGELMALSQNSKTKEIYLRGTSDQQMVLRAALDECDVVLNPCHTAFPFLGGLTKKREFLGSGRRIYVSAANLCPEKQFKRINQLQTCFCGGRQIDKEGSSSVLQEDFFMKVYILCPERPE